MTILVLGAGGRLGRHVVSELIERGQSVRAFIHKNNPLSQHPNLEIFSGDVHQAKDIEAALCDVNAIISALGSAASSVKDVSSTAMSHLIPAMKEHGIDRIISSTGSAACLDSERDNPHPSLKARHDRMMLGNPELVLDGEVHMRMLEQSDLNWTVIRAPFMGGEPEKEYTLSDDPPPPETVSSYLTVANAMIDLIGSDEWSGRAPFVF